MKQPEIAPTPKVEDKNRLDKYLDDDETLAADSTQRVPSQRAVKAFVQKAWPVGAVFIAVVGTDPALLLGYGTWTAFGAGRILFLTQ